LNCLKILYLLNINVKKKSLQNQLLLKTRTLVMITKVLVRSTYEIK